MNQGKYVFAQLVVFLPARIFDRCVATYNGNKWVKHFSCWNQLMVMMFGQLSGRDSLRDLLVTISAHSGKYYHLGFGKGVSRSNLAAANEQRDYRIYEELAYEMIAMARGCVVKDPDILPAVAGNVYAFDSTTIDLCLNVFWWATFRTAKGGIKVHTLYDIKTSIPCFLLITEALLHDVNALDELNYEPGGYYIMDKGYIDYKRLYRIHCCQAFFVTRAKDNFRFARRYSSKVDKSKGILCDQTVMLSGFYAKKDYPQPMRRIKFFDAEQERSFVFITNNFSLAAEDIALLYKYRWKVELFFKWIKGHLKIKSFWGTSMNAVKTQVYIAVITYVLVAIIRSKLKINRSAYEMLQILSASLFDKTQLNQLLQSDNSQNLTNQDPNSLQISLF
ncbi:MAG: IS4 family transposase [Chitinophagaceae bacterium]